MKKMTNIQCKECGFNTTKTGIAQHIKYTHKLSIDDYVSKHGEYRPNKLREIKHNTQNTVGEFVCQLCNTTFSTTKRLMHHVHSIHHLTTNEYIKRYIFNNIPQLCPCGCQKEVKYLNYPPYKKQCITGHNSKYANGMYGKTVTDTTRSLQSTAAINRGVTASKKNTSIEIAFKKYLIDNNIQFIEQYPTEYGIVDFYLPTLDKYIEIDGSYWHPKILVNLNFNQMSNIINDIRKNKSIKNLIRISDKDIETGNISLTYKDLENDIVINNYDNFLSKEFLIDYKSKKGEYKLNQKIDVILKFIKTISPEFPYDNINDFNIIDTCNKLSTYSTVLEGNVFYNNQCSSIGTRELKSLFRSFYASKNLHSFTPEEVWSNNDIMRRLIRYRIGLNNSNEVFNISLNQMRRAITVNKYTVSWFKPHLAMDIYKTFLKDIETPIVLDPCAGFGARMLGFYSAYPNGTYIGIEPNIDTFNELVKLNTLLGKNSILINDRYENVDITKFNYNIAFTSIPYWDIEIYSSDHTQYYKDYEDWLNIFLYKIKNTPNIIVNIPEMLYDKFDNIKDEYYIQNNTSHFNNKSSHKIEYLLCLK